jgi:hypothetical protein
MGSMLNIKCEPLYEFNRKGKGNCYLLKKALSSDLIQNIKKDIHQQAIYIGCKWLKKESLNQVNHDERKDANYHCQKNVIWVWYHNG